MKGRGDNSYVVRVVFCSLVVIISVESQLAGPSFEGPHNLGIPLPTIKRGQESTQGQQHLSPSKFGVIQDNRENSKSVSNIEQFGISLPTLGQKLGGNEVYPPNSVHRSSGVRGPGSLQHIKEPSQDKSVSELINHPVVLKTIQKETRSDKKVKVDYIISAHKQVVSGQLTYLDLKVVKTRCPVGASHRLNCPVDTTEDPFVCEIVVWQRPWLNTTKIINEKTKCAELEDDNDFKNWNRGNGGLRSMSRASKLTSVPPHLDESQLALEAYDYINRGSESKFKGRMIDYKFGEVKHDPILNLTLIEVKVEYGFTLCLKFPNRKVDDRVCPVDQNRTNYICTVKVISDPQLTTNLKVMPDDDDEIDCHKKRAITEELVVAVKAVCAGCPHAISLNDPVLLPMAEFAVIEYDRQSNDDELHKMIKLHKARTQVVNGIKYFLTIELIDTDCRKPLSAVNMNRTLCNADFTDETDICEIVIFEQPWQKSREFISASCRDSFSPDAFIVPSHGLFEVVGSGMAPSPHSGISGSVVSQASTSSISDYPSAMQDSIKFLLDEVNRIEVDDYDDGFYKILNIHKASSVSEPSGQVDIIVLELGETICRDRKMADNCRLKFGEEHEFCTGRVLRETSSFHRGISRRVVQLECDDDKDEHFYLAMHPSTSPFLLSNRPFFAPKPGSLGVPGAPVQKSVSSNVTSEIAHFIVDQYNLQNDDDELYKLGKVLSSYSQLSGSVKHTIELELLETVCKKYQPIIDVSKCPIDRSEEPELCQAEVTLTFSHDGKSIESKKLLRMFCDDREDFYVKKMRRFGTSTPTLRSGFGLSRSENVSDKKIQLLGERVADEFDFRSDEDHIFKLFRVIAAKALETGLSHIIRVELAQTVCPKYKQKIDKTRCVVDIGEEHKICDAHVTEQPWSNSYEIARLRCFERDDSVEDEDESREVVYRKVHPSAHARPKFLQSRYKVRLHSQESAESNERYYSKRGVLLDDSPEDDSDEYRHHFNRRSPRFDDDDDDDLDSDRPGEPDSRSDERHGRNRFESNETSERFQSDESRSSSRFRWSRRRNSRRPSKREVSVVRRAEMKIPGGKHPADLNDPELLKIAAIGVEHMDRQLQETKVRRVEKIIEASSQVVAGVMWQIKTLVSYTDCDVGSVGDKTACSFCRCKPSQHCDMKVWSQPWKNFIQLQEFNCVPIPS